MDELYISNISLSTLRPDKSEPSLLCQKGMKDCKNITMYQENHNKWLFVMLNIGQEAMNMAYQCEFTVETNNIYEYETGTPTILLPGMFNPLEDV